MLFVRMHALARRLAIPLAAAMLVALAALGAAPGLPGGGHHEMRPSDGMAATGGPCPRPDASAAIGSHAAVDDGGRTVAGDFGSCCTDICCPACVAAWAAAVRVASAGPHVSAMWPVGPVSPARPEVIDPPPRHRA